MQISCSHCNAHYSLSDEDIGRLTQSIFVCTSCRTFIKITLCPHCRSSYSISFKASHNERYRLRCRRCDRHFMVDFPAIQDGMEAAPGRNDTLRAQPPRPALRNQAPERQDQGARAEIPPRAIDPPRTQHARENRSAQDHGAPAEKSAPKSPVLFKGVTFRDFSLAELASVALSAFAPVKMAAAACGAALSVLLVFLANMAGFSSIAAQSGTPEIVRLALYILPMTLLFIIYIFTSALIARSTLDFVFSGRHPGPARLAAFAGNSLPQVCVNSVLMLLLADVVILLIGNIPLVGPVIYSLLFIPAYLASFMIIVMLVIGIWFYPPIVAYREPGIIKNTVHLLHFVKRHNLGLIPATLTLFVVTGFLCTVAYLLHWGAFALTLKLSRGILPQETGKIFASVPGAFIKISDLLQGSPDRGVFISVIGDLFVSHQVGGVLLGTALALISLGLFTSALSLSGTLSTHVYLMMERDLDLDDRKKVRMLFVIVLMLAGAMLVKKLLW